MNLKKLNLTVLLVTILVLVPTIQIVYASSLSTFYLSGGIYPHGVSYTFWREGSYYYAKNAYGFQPSWSGSTNASYVIQNSINDKGTAGGTFYFKNAIYSIDVPLTVPLVAHANIHYTLKFKGESIYGTILNASTSLGANCIFESGLSDWGGYQIRYLFIEDMTFEANNSSDGHISADYLSLVLNNLYLTGSLTDSYASIGLYGGGGGAPSWTSIINNVEIGFIGTDKVRDAYLWYEGLNIIALSIQDLENRQCSLQIAGTSCTINKLVIGAVSTTTWVNGIIWVRTSNNHLSIQDIFVADGASGTKLIQIDSGLDAWVDIESLWMPTDFNLSFNSYTKARVYVHGGYNNKAIRHGGTIEASNDDWVSFNVTFGGTPSVILTIEENDANYFAQVKDGTTNTTHFQLYLYDASASALETVDKTINWYAEYNP